MGLGLDNNLKIIFGLALDGYRSPKKCNRIGELVCGPATLLDVLEIRLGLRAKAVPFARRVAQYRTLLQQANFDQPRFYSASFERDPIASAEVLLRWRDDLVLAGWEGSVRTSDSQRLQDLAAVETLVAGVLAHGVGDRLNGIIREIENRDPHLSGIEVIDDAGHLPTLFRQLFERLGAAFGNRSRESLEPTAEPGTDLRKIQEALLKPGGKLELRGDESVLFFTAGSEVSLAQFAAQILANLRRQQRATSLVAEFDCLHIDAALRALNEPILAMVNFPRFRGQGGCSYSRKDCRHATKSSTL